MRGLELSTFKLCPPSPPTSSEMRSLYLSRRTQQDHSYHILPDADDITELFHYLNFSQLYWRISDSEEGKEVIELLDKWKKQPRTLSKVGLK